VSAPLRLVEHEVDPKLLSAETTPRRALSDITNRVTVGSPRGGKRSGAGRPSSADRKAREEEQGRIYRTAQLTSNTQRAHLREQLQSLANPSGRTLTVQENRVVLALLLALQLMHHNTVTQAINTVAQWVGSSHTTVRSVWQRYQTEGQVPEPVEHIRGAAAASHPWRRTLLSADAISLLQLSLLKSKQSAKHCSSRLLAVELEKKLHVSVHPSTIQRWLRKIGYKWKSSHSIGARSDSRIRGFIKEYAVALKQQEEGKAVLVYIDESFVHTGHHCRYGWFSDSNEVRRKSGRGKRLILLHAMSKDGLLAKKDNEGEVMEVSADVSERAPNAELVFSGLNVDEDYHKSMDGEVFMEWVKQRLLPAFRARYRGKQMILVLDNAPYHHAHAPGWKSAQSMSKGEAAAFLVTHHGGQLKIIRDGTEHSFGLTSLFRTKASKYVPSKQEMTNKIREILKAKPELSHTQLQSLFHKTDYQLLFTPPYTPQVQPIELVWAHVKNYVARQTTKDTTEEQLRAIVRRGFYGDDASDHEAVDAPLCTRLVKHCHAWMDKFIEIDEDLDGDLMNLSYCGDAESDDDKDLETDNRSDEDSDTSSEDDSDEDEDTR
jgi:transposase